MSWTQKFLTWVNGGYKEVSVSAVDASTGAADAGKLVQTNSQGYVDPLTIAEPSRYGVRGGPLNPFVVETAATVTENYTITTGFNGISGGPISVAAGKSVTVPPGSEWTVVGGKGTWFKSGDPLPLTNIGPIWHDDYNSLMTWHDFTSNGADYHGYASQLVGSLLLDTQPTPRIGYVKSGASALSRTTYAALRNWAIHNGLLVAAGTWVAGSIAIKDNADGTTFTIYDIRGEFLRSLDDGRGVDSSRAFGSFQQDTLQSHQHLMDMSADAGGSFNAFAGRGSSQVQPGSSATGQVTISSRTSGETRTRNTALLATVKF